MKFMLTSVFAVSVSARMYGPGSGFTLRRSANASANLRDSTSSSHGRDSEVSSTGGKPAMLGDRPLMVPRGSSVTLSDVNAVGDDPGSASNLWLWSFARLLTQLEIAEAAHALWQRRRQRRRQRQKAEGSAEGSATHVQFELDLSDARKQVKAAITLTESPVSSLPVDCLSEKFSANEAKNLVSEAMVESPTAPTVLRDMVGRSDMTLHQATDLFLDAFADSVTKPGLVIPDPLAMLEQAKEVALERLSQQKPVLPGERNHQLKVNMTAALFVAKLTVQRNLKQQPKWADRSNPTKLKRRDPQLDDRTAAADPCISINDARWLAQSVYERPDETDTSCEARARTFIEDFGGGEHPRTVGEVKKDPMAGFDADYKYEVLDSYHFEDARGIGSGWNVMCVKQMNRQAEADIHHVLVFEGTSSIINDWLWDLRTLNDDYHMDWGLVTQMNTKIQEWMTSHDISKFGAHIGHSAGAVFAKACGRFGEHGNTFYNRQDAYLITFNGYDPFHEWGFLHLDFRAVGDIVSACIGAHKMFTVDTLGDARNIVDAHRLPEMDFSGVNYNTVDAHTEEGRFQFKAKHKTSGELNAANAAVIRSQEDHANQCFKLMGQLTASAAARVVCLPLQLAAGVCHAIGAAGNLLSGSRDGQLEAVHTLVATEYIDDDAQAKKFLNETQGEYDDPNIAAQEVPKILDSIKEYGVDAKLAANVLLDALKTTKSLGEAKTAALRKWFRTLLMETPSPATVKQIGALGDAQIDEFLERYKAPGDKTSILAGFRSEIAA